MSVVKKPLLVGVANAATYHYYTCTHSLDRNFCFRFLMLPCLQAIFLKSSFEGKEKLSHISDNAEERLFICFILCLCSSHGDVQRKESIRVTPWHRAVYPCPLFTNSKGLDLHVCFPPPKAGDIVLSMSVPQSARSHNLSMSPLNGIL